MSRRNAIANRIVGILRIVTFRLRQKGNRREPDGMSRTAISKR